METGPAPQGEDNDSNPAHAIFEELGKAFQTGNVSEAEAATRAIWQHLAENQPAEPSPWLEAMGEAHRSEAIFDWPAAEQAYTRAVNAAAEQPGLQSSAYRELSQFHQLFSRQALAASTAHLATEAARRQNVNSMVAIALRNEASLQLKSKNYPAAWNLITEAFSVLEEGPMHNLPRAFALLVRADYLIERARLSEAEADLANAWDFLKPWSEAHFAGGWQSCFALWWSAKARLQSQRGDASGAEAAWREAVTRRRIIAELPQLEGPYKHNFLAIVLGDLGRALEATSDPLAGETFAESRSIRAAIGLPPLS